MTGASISSEYVEVDGIRLHYLDGGSGDAVLFLHGWPTSSFLWRNIVGPIAENNRILALDLPGFGQSDKPLDASYSFRFFQQILEGFLDAVNVEATSLVVHDLGGPIGLFWASHHPDKLQKLALLNTLVYPKQPWAVILFVMACRTPGVRAWLSGPRGLRFSMRLGIHDRSHATEEMIKGVQAPFETKAARKALLKAACNLHPQGLARIAHKLPSLKAPVRIIYGEHDRILPDVAQTMQQVVGDMPQAEVTSLDCGHFLQEEQPEEIARMLADFFGAEVKG